jgi:predicted RND superfamily exporter protein
MPSPAPGPRTGVAGRVLDRALRARPRRLLAACVVLVVACGLLAARGTGTSADLLAGGRSDVGRATQAQRAALGDEPVVVVASGDLRQTLAPANLMALMRLEGRLARLDGVRSVFGPATFVNQTVLQIERVLRAALGPAAERADRDARAAAAAARARGADAGAAQRAGERARLRGLGPARDDYAQLLVRYGYIGLPAIDNRAFVSALVYGSGTAPKRRFGWLFPDARHAVIYVRPRAGLSDAQTRRLGEQMERLAGGTRAGGARLRVAGAPLVAAAMSRSSRDELIRLAPLALLAMALVLLLGYRARAPRLHLLGLAVVASTITAGAAVAAGLGLTPATVAALPVVIGLTVDYAVQLQARYWREREGHGPEEAARRATRAIARILLPAGAATCAGFAVLMASEVPLLARLGATLVIGTAVGFAVVLVVGGRLLTLRDGRGVPGALRWRAPHGRGSRWVVAAGCAAAGAGLVAGTRAPIESDIARLVAPGQPELRAVQAVQRELRTSGQLRIAVSGENVAWPSALAWMRDAQRRMERLDARLEPGPNLGELLLTGASNRPTAEEVRSLLRVVPRYLVGAVMTKDGRRAEMSVGIPLMPVEQQRRLLRRIDAVLATAPPGLHAEPAGLLASAAASIGVLQDERTALLLLAALAIVVVLAVARRRLDRALVALVPALLAAGLSGLAIWALGLRLTPLSAGLETLVLAVGVEFGVLMDARYQELRLTGLGPGAASERARETGAPPVIASAATVSAGFLVLALSGSAVMRQFGLLVAFELVLCLVAAVALVTPLAAAADRAQMARARRPAAARVPRLVRLQRRSP